MPALQHVLSKYDLEQTTDPLCDLSPGGSSTFSISRDVFYNLLEMQAKISGCWCHLLLTHLPQQPLSNPDKATTWYPDFTRVGLPKMLNKCRDSRKKASFGQSN